MDGFAGVEVGIVAVDHGTVVAAHGTVAVPVPVPGTVDVLGTAEVGLDIVVADPGTADDPGIAEVVPGIVVGDLVVGVVGRLDVAAVDGHHNSYLPHEVATGKADTK